GRRAVRRNPRVRGGRGPGLARVLRVGCVVGRVLPPWRAHEGPSWPIRGRRPSRRHVGQRVGGGSGRRYPGRIRRSARRPRRRPRTDGKVDVTPGHPRPRRPEDPMSIREEPWANGTPCWSDLTTTDQPAAIAFYTRMFGWQVEDKGPRMGHYGLA